MLNQFKTAIANANHAGVVFRLFHLDDFAHTITADMCGFFIDLDRSQFSEEIKDFINAVNGQANVIKCRKKLCIHVVWSVMLKVGNWGSD